ATSLPIVAGASYRPGEAHQRPEVLYAIEACAEIASHITVPPLAERDSIGLLESIIGHGVDSDFARALHVTSAGIPELLVGLASGGLDPAERRRFSEMVVPKIPAELCRLLEDRLG